MTNRRSNQDFNNKKNNIQYLFNSIPTQETLNFFIHSCFYDITSQTFRNLEEEDREHAHFHDLIATEEEWLLRKEEYYLKFPKNKFHSYSYSSFGKSTKSVVANFEDLIITPLSIEILKFNYFEYCLNKKVNDFKELYSSFIIKYLHTHKHQLFSLNDELEKNKELDSLFKDDKLKINNINVSKFQDLIENTKKELSIFMESFNNLIKSNNQEIVSIYDKSRSTNLLEVIDNKDSLELFYKFEKYLETTNHINNKSKSWSTGYGSKSSFMRFYMKCREHELIRRGAWDKLIRKLSDIYQIDNVSKYDFGEDRCKDALDKNPDEFKELNSIKSQHNLNKENN